MDFGERFEEKRQARQRPTTPLQSDLARRCEVDRQKKLNSDVPKALSDFYSDIFEFPHTVQGQTLRQAPELSRWCHSRDFSATELPSARTARTGHHKHVVLTGLRDTVVNSRSTPGAPKAFSEQTVGIQACLLLADDERVAWLCLVGSVWETRSPTRSKRACFHKTDASHGDFVLERASEFRKEWTLLFLAQLDLKKAFGHIQPPSQPQR